MALHISANVCFPYWELRTADKYVGSTPLFPLTRMIYPTIIIGSSKSNTQVFPTNSFLRVIRKPSRAMFSTLITIYIFTNTGNLVRCIWTLGG